jgi:glucose-1-phosphate adenylyltransferase
MKALGIVFSNIHDGDVAELTRHRTLASVPFCGRYRLIDFVLSNMTNSGITKVGVITKNNYQSLMDHIGSGKHWDLSRKNGGVMVLPPFGATESTALYQNRLDAIKGAMSILYKSSEDYVIMTDCDNVCSIDYRDILDKHIARAADITVVYNNAESSTDSRRKRIIFDIDEKERVRKVTVSEKPAGTRNKYLNIMCVSRAFLIRIIEDAIEQGLHSFSREVLTLNVDNYKIFGYNLSGYFACIDSLQSYYKYNMEMLDCEKRNAVFNKKGLPVYTKVKDSPPARYLPGGSVSNSLIADGCVIEGRVENSILFRGVKIGEGSVVTNSIIMQDSIVSRGAKLNAVVTDKNVFITEKRALSGCDALPYCLGKSAII